MRTIKYLFAGALMLSVSASAMAQDVKSQIDAITKVIVSNNGAGDVVKNQVKDFLKANKKDATALAGLGRAYLDVKNQTEALKYAEMAIKAGKNNAAGYLLKGDIAATNDDGGEAASWYQMATTMDPKNPDGYIKYARIYQKVDAAGAAEYLEKLRALDPTYPVDAQIAYMYSKNGKMAKAVEYYDKVRDWSKLESYLLSDYAVSSMMLGQPEKSLEIAKKGLAVNPRNAGFNRIAFYDCTDLKRYDEALVYADALFNKTDSMKELTNDYKYLAYAQKGAGKFEESIKSFNKVFEMDNTQTDILKQISDAYLETNNTDKAIEYYEKYIAHVDNKKVSDYTALAKIYLTIAENEGNKKENLLKADKVYADMAETFPSNLDYATYQRAHIHHQINGDVKQGEAKPYYEKYAELVEAKAEKSKADLSTLAEAYNYLAVYYIQNDEVAKAKEYAEKLQALQPDNDTAKQILAL